MRNVHFALVEGEDTPACGDPEPRWLSTDQADVTCPDCKDWLR